MDLPLDLTLCVFDYLEAHDATALSLACKGLFQHLFADARTLFANTDKNGRLKVQTMLEKDLPEDQIYCGFCAAFHPLDEDYRAIFCKGHRHYSLKSFIRHTTGTRTFGLEYLDARSMMNAILFKRPSKLLETFRQTHWDWYGSHEWEERWEPEMRGEELFLRIDSRHMEYNASDNGESFTYSVCKHVHIHARYPHIWADEEQLGGLCLSDDMDHASGTCRTCSADWAVELEWPVEPAARGGTGWAARILSRHRLGGLRSPNDWVWRRSAGEYVTPQPRPYGDTSRRHPGRYQDLYMDRDQDSHLCGGLGIWPESQVREPEYWGPILHLEGRERPTCRARIPWHVTTSRYRDLLVGDPFLG